MKQELERLRTILAEIADLDCANALLGWDQQVNMPPQGAESRGLQMGTLGRLSHDRATSAELGRLLDTLRPYAEKLDPDTDDARLVKVASRDFDKAVRVPSDYVAELAHVTAPAYQAWTEAKKSSRFSLFQPHLEKILGLLHRYVGFFPPAAHPYDVLLDGFEPGMKTAEVFAIFDTLRPRQVALVKTIGRAMQVDDSFLHQPFDEKAQWAFGVEVITDFGYDWSRGRQDTSPHPFTQSLGINDVRITTRVDPEYLGSGLFATLHECGHALYGMGHAPALERTGLADGASLGVHESQSRLWENLVGRSLPFWRRYYPILQGKLPQLAAVPLERFYKGINRVQPSLIRVEADEATYNLHIMLRMEIEIGLLTETIAVKDLPEAWNARMKEYLGLTPPDDARGVLQDVHWSTGGLGYFPTYALGNLISAQLWEKIHGDLPDIEGQIAQGWFAPLLSWLREKIHVHGRKFTPQELVKRVTGSAIDPAPYLRYLEKKYEEIYGL